MTTKMQIISPHDFCKPTDDEPKLAMQDIAAMKDRIDQGTNSFEDAMIYLAFIEIKAQLEAEL